MTLYHGSNTEIDNIDLNKCQTYKDFGCGFYTTPLKEHALSMAKRTARMFIKGKPCITEFYCDDNLFITETGSVPALLNIKKFSE